MIYLKHKKLGKCEVICHYKDVGIVELKNNYEKYVVAINLSAEKGIWRKGIYCKSLKDAGEVFNNILEYFYMVSFKI